MKQDSIQDSTRYVVSNIHHGSVLPGTRAEMSRNVYLLSKADIKGGVWANELTIKGSGISVKEAVYSRGPISIEASDDKASKRNAKKTVVFGSCVVSADSILVNQLPYKIRFMSDVYSEKINLTNSIVYGNVFANNAIIKNSIVLGGAFCKEKLEIENSMISTFRTKKVLLNENVFLFFPFALAETPITIKEPVKALTFLNMYKDLKKNSESKSKKKDGGVIYLDEDDIFEIFPEESEKDKDIDGDSEGSKKTYVLSGNERILDVIEVEKHFQYNRKFLENLTLGSHYDPSLKSEKFKQPLEELEKNLWDILGAHKEFTTIEGSSKMQELFERADVLAVLGID